MLAEICKEDLKLIMIIEFFNTTRALYTAAFLSSYAKLPHDKKNYNPCISSVTSHVYKTTIN
jgi:hypothetical protein